MKKEHKKQFGKYLARKGYADRTITSYLFAVEYFTRTLVNYHKAKLSEILLALSECANVEKRLSVSSAVTISAVRLYYEHLNEKSRRSDLPTLTVRSRQKRNRVIIHQDLFTQQELRQILTIEERYLFMRVRNRIIMHLLIGQALLPEEIVQLCLSDFNIDERTISVSGTRRTARRCMPLTAEQTTDLQFFISEERNKFLKKRSKYLLLTKQGTHLSVGEIHYLLKRAQPLFPERNLNTIKVRQSVISYWLNRAGYSLEQVQMLAGHKWISSTERYYCEDLNAKIAIIDVVHPLEVGL
jgi:integrase/recombinase XerD